MFGRIIKIVNEKKNTIFRPLSFNKSLYKVQIVEIATFQQYFAWPLQDK